MTDQLSEVERLRAEIAALRDDVRRPSRRWYGWLGLVRAEWVAGCLNHIIAEPINPDKPGGWRASR